MYKICPLPIIWDQVYKQLLSQWELGGKNGIKPPIPLILGGWNYSNDNEKMIRWHQTVEWANNYNMNNLVDAINEQDFYFIDNITKYRIGPMGGPMYLDWSFIPKQRLSEEIMKIKLDLLKKSWEIIVGKELGSITLPVEFTGKKGRRLVVKVSNSLDSPWGGWDWRYKDKDKRYEFTIFRKRINEQISPHMVDHVEFIIQDN